MSQETVTTFAVVWIEIPKNIKQKQLHPVTTFAVVWIEILRFGCSMG